jgi:gamma-glutamyltranspeptidase/glutathione hydrolase
MIARGAPVNAAVDAPRVHFEDGAVQAEPGIDEAALERLAERGYEIVRWADFNVFFGGVHAVARDPARGELVGAGDARRGGAVAYA